MRRFIIDVFDSRTLCVTDTKTGSSYLVGHDNDYVVIADPGKPWSADNVLPTIREVQCSTTLEAPPVISPRDIAGRVLSTILLSPDGFYSTDVSLPDFDKYSSESVTKIQSLAGSMLQKYNESTGGAK